jgi:polyhydroxyalkanoate synthesis regulator phasin
LLYNGTHYSLGVVVVAKSKAKKLRDKLVREGKMNPEIKRSPFVLTDMRTRITKTRKDHIYQFKNKNHRFQDGNDGSYYLLYLA